MNNPDTPPTAPFALPDHSVISLDGRDAVAFAQAQTMNDVAALVDGQWHWNGWLTPKGRVVALFALLRLDAERLWLLLPDADAQAIADGLQRFVFRSKVKIAFRDDLHVSGAFRSPATASGDALAESGDSRGELDVGTAEAPRCLAVGGPMPEADAAAAERWRAYDLMHGLPRLDAGQAEQWTPQQLSLDRLKAYSVKKGCYPGQEIVARTHFLGQAKRGLVLLEGNDGLATGMDVTAGGRDIGRIASAAGNLALAVLPLERDAGEALSVDEHPLQVRPLLDGLAR